MTDLFTYRAFDGDTYDPERDFARLAGQLSRVYSLMRDGRWRSLAQISIAIGGTEASVSARLRDLRKSKYGSHEVERKNIEGGLFNYRLILKQSAG